jgi:hypothetical protein
VGIYGGPGKREVWVRNVFMVASGARRANEKIFTAAEGLVDIATRNPD